MPNSDVALPLGYRLATFDSLDSANAEAMRRAQAGEPGGLWVQARTQTAGRGRAGRSWWSAPGNLYASLLLQPACPLPTALQLALVAGLAAHDAVLRLAAGRLTAPLVLKWPNDLLLGEAKLGGVLLESTCVGPCVAIVVGTGLNLGAHPADSARPVTDLAAHGIEAPSEAAFACLAQATADRLGIWAEGAGFADIRADWEARAIPMGCPIRVRLGAGDEEGAYGGIDASGAMRLIAPSGEERIVTAGDVFMD